MARQRGERGEPHQRATCGGRRRNYATDSNSSRQRRVTLYSFAMGKGRSAAAKRAAGASSPARRQHRSINSIGRRAQRAHGSLWSTALLRRTRHQARSCARDRRRRGDRVCGPSGHSVRDGLRPVRNVGAHAGSLAVRWYLPPTGCWALSQGTAMVNETLSCIRAPWFHRGSGPAPAPQTVRRWLPPLHARHRSHQTAFEDYLA
jgi:hypothetical protein